MAPRFAIYFSPADDTQLALFGKAVLSRTATNILPLDTDHEAAWGDLLGRPRHYGFHATLKAPFELSDASSEQRLLDAVEALAQTLSTCSLAGLKVKEFNGFAALAFDQQPASVAELARLCLLELEPHRAPLSDFDYQRRDPARLSPRQRQNLSDYGYHHVLEDFDFHMTLSGALGQKKKPFLAFLEREYARIASDTAMLDRLCVFSQRDREDPFVRIADIPLGDVRSYVDFQSMPSSQKGSIG